MLYYIYKRKRANPQPTKHRERSTLKTAKPERLGAIHNIAPDGGKVKEAIL